MLFTMSAHFSNLIPTVSKKSSCIAIVASQYNAHLVDAMLEQAEQEIKKLQPNVSIEIVRVPGAFEIPLFVKLIAKKKKADAIIALGVLLQGETAHADLVATSVSQALMALSIECSLPVIHQVLLLNNEAQAMDRCINETKNRGIEAARVAVSAIEVIKKIA